MKIDATILAGKDQQLSEEWPDVHLVVSSDQLDSAGSSDVASIAESGDLRTPQSSLYTEEIRK